MRRALPFVLLAAALGIGGLALAQPPSGIVRPQGQQRKPLVQQGAQLYAANCSSCHGIAGRGVTNPPLPGSGDIKGQGPPLVGVGARAADFYLRTGYMPLRNPHDQPYRSRVLFTDQQIRALTAYVASLGPGPPIPTPQPETGSLSKGLNLFTEHCAGCHQVVGEGGYVTDVRVPTLKKASATEIAEAVRIGPYLMPEFSKRAISDGQLDSIIAYVEHSKNPTDRGGWGIGHIGPVPEGIVAWFIAALALVAVCAWIGERVKSS
jgi:ubiquinol-cytochrome c reductase cytochrome c subunit